MLPQAMHLVYRALEKEPVPALLPSALVPPSKRKKSLGSVSGSLPGLPTSPPPPKDSLRSTPSHGSMNSLNSTGSLSPKHTLKSGQVIHTLYITWIYTHIQTPYPVNKQEIVLEQKIVKHLNDINKTNLKYLHSFEIVFWSSIVYVKPDAFLTLYLFSPFLYASYRNILLCFINTVRVVSEPLSHKIIEQQIQGKILWDTIKEKLWCGLCLSN